MHCDQESVWNKQTIIPSINRNVLNQWLITEQFSIIDLMLDSVDKISENGRNIYELNQINQTILEIDFDRTFWNGRPLPVRNWTFWRFGISKYHQYSIFRNTFQCHWTRILETRSSRIDGCQIRKIYIPSFSNISLVLRILNEQESLSLP